MGCCNNNWHEYHEKKQPEKVFCQCYKEEKQEIIEHKPCFEEKKKHDFGCGCNKQQLY